MAEDRIKTALSMTLEQSEQKFWEILARGQSNGRKFDLEGDFCPFWQVLHAKGYANGLPTYRIAEYVGPLWPHKINSEDDLLEACAQDYYQVKKDVFLDDRGAIRFFEKCCPDILDQARVNVTVKLSGREVHELEEVAPT
ncbi:MAG: hypothetical protein SGARI_005660, partial [Bacillariaceae sp.]